MSDCVEHTGDVAGISTRYPFDMFGVFHGTSHHGSIPMPTPEEETNGI